MVTTRIILCTILYIFLAVDVRIARSQELTVAQGLDLLEGSIQAIHSFDVRTDCSIKSFLKQERTKPSPGKRDSSIISSRKLMSGEQPSVLRASNRQVYQRGKGRIEFFGPNNSPTTVLVFDGEMQKSYDAAAGSALLRDVPHHALQEGWSYLEAYRNVFGVLPILHCFRERRNVVVRVSKDDSMIVFEAAPAPKANIDFPNWGFRVSLDKRHGLMPAVIERFEQINNKPFIVRRSSVSQWTELGSGTWAPSKLVTHFFDADLTLATFGELSVEEELVVDLKRSHWNRQIPNDMFELPLPAGTRVTDRLRDVQFVTGQLDPGKNLEELAKHAKKVTPYPVERPQSIKDRSIWSWIGMAGVLTIVGIGGLSLIYRNRNRRIGRNV